MAPHQPNHSHRSRRRAVLNGSVAFATLATTVALVSAPTAALAPPVATQLDLVGPTGSEKFGEQVLVLSNGNIVVTDPGFDAGGVTDVGAVHLYDGTSNQLISTLTGSTVNDTLGDRTPLEVGNGNFVIANRTWDFGAAADAGAVTFVNGTTGLNGAVGPDNSLHGTTMNDHISNVTVLADGDYVVSSGDWDNGAVANAGAVVFANGSTGINGPVTPANSLHGTTANDRVGNRRILALSNGNYVVGSPDWDNGATVNVGASTFAKGPTGIVGPVSPANSLHGTTANDFVGGSSYEVGASNYVVSSSSWSLPGPIGDVGAITWANGETGIVGPVTQANSLHGSTTEDNIGNSGVTTLTNGNYVVGSQQWDFGAVVDVGAATWADGSTRMTGPVTTANSLHGTHENDNIAVNGVVALTNGNYVVNGNVWDNGTISDAGASTWGNGTTGISGPVSITNSLYGTSPSEGFQRAVPLTNGNYVVPVTSWDNGTTVDVGAAVWADGATGITGAVSITNGLHGTSAGDRVGRTTALPGGNYVVASAQWDNDTISNAGAATMANGVTGLTGPVTAANSLHGTTAEDSVGSSGITLLTDGNFVVHSERWDNGANADVGAVTWVDAAAGLTGAVTADNSLHGATASDAVGYSDGDSAIVPLPRGHYAVATDSWDRGADINVGAITLGRSGGANGAVTETNSAIGTPPGVVLKPAPRLTSGHAVVVPTTQNRVLLLLSDLLALDPARLLDTRSGPGISTADGLALGWGRVGAGRFIDIQIAGRGGVPKNATTATLNLATISPSAAGFGTLYPCTTDIPTASSLNYSAGANISNAVLVTLSATGTVCLFSSAEAHYALDVVGYTPAGSKVGTLEPARLLDTRTAAGITTIDSQSLGSGRVASGNFVEVKIAGRGGVPADASAATVNIAAIAPTAKGFVTLYPCSTTRPLVSSLNYEAATNISNTTLVKLSATGTLCVYTSSESDLALDVVGFVPPGSNIGTLEPARLLDTRSGAAVATIDGLATGAGVVIAGTKIETQVTGRGSVPAGATSAFVNLATINPFGKGFATLYPCTEQAPNASSLNYEQSTNTSNSTLVKLSATGSVCIFTSASTHLALDVVGYVE